MNQIFFNLVQKLRSFLFWLLQQDGSPAQRARGIAVGVFSGCFPLFGLQTFLGIILASLCRGNRLIAATATWISNPFTYIPLYWLNYKVGATFFGGKQSFLTLHQLTTNQLWNQGWIFSVRILIGSTVVGLIFGTAIGGLSYLLMKYVFVRKDN